ncbi:MAG TPA: CoA transferase [Gammaproteobacteria bacterium]|nr:carnitine dehydratase [Gammaproteobacteria bacterium]HBK77089.1 carnitine dehydratase [Gammaproteobacteria bacterium]HHZ72913.1 CoA transferase [Gammaproteobacteria bacterium]HIA41763.1 CoA transferase [Gammaproteobacteria bacterium]HIB06538.1 CoA transferase [Gammaproteobacteria bacterium]
MPLKSLRVIDLTRILAGPFCTQLLADLGADVIKIEGPRGDPVRQQGIMVDGLSWYFAQFNRNKKSVVLDLYGDSDKNTLSRLLETADVLVENFRPGVLSDMGFGPGELEILNPRLIHASVNGYGTTGPYADRPSFDFIAQAMSGFMSVNGPPDGEPQRAAPPISDLVAGLYCAFGILAALHERESSGVGQQVESSLTGGLISMLAYLSAEYFATGEIPKRTGNDHPIVSPYGLFRAKDGMIAVAPSTDVYVEKFLSALGLEQLLSDPHYATNSDRLLNRDALSERINKVTCCQSVNHWIKAINHAGCPCGRVLDLAEVFEDPQVLAQDMVLNVPHPGHGNVRMTGFPVKLSRTPAGIQRPAPDLGADTKEILDKLDSRPL